MAQRTTIDRLLFVYNADSGKWSAFVDSARKVLKIQGCTLCSITHGLTGEKEDWRDCKDELGVPVDYVHRDEVTARLSENIGERRPAVVAEAGGNYTVLLGPEVLDRCRGSVADFKGRLMAYASMNALQFPQEAPSIPRDGLSQRQDLPTS